MFVEKFWTGRDVRRLFLDFGLCVRELGDRKANDLIGCDDMHGIKKLGFI